MTRLDREAWLAAAFDALHEGGVGGVRINPLCRALGVTKGSFYWHFEGRDALLRAMLEDWERRGTETIIELVDGLAGTPTDRLRLLARTTFAESPQTDRIEAAIRAWAAADEHTAAAVARVDERRLAYVRDLLRAAGVSRAAAAHRAAILYRALIGEFTWRSHGGKALPRSAIDQLVRMMLHDV